MHRTGFIPSTVARVAALLAAAALAACATEPAVRLHTLVAAADAVPPAAGASMSSAPSSIMLRVNGVPAQVDQPQWLVRLPDDTLRSLEQERWAAPLREEIRAGLLQALAAREGVAEAVGPRSEAGAPAPRVTRVAVDVTRFESLPGREARVDAGWTIDPAGLAQPAAATGAASVAASVAGVVAMPAAPFTCRGAWREPVAAGAPALAEGHRRIVAKLAAAIGQSLRSGRCPG